MTAQEFNRSYPVGCEVVYKNPKGNGRFEPFRTWIIAPAEDPWMPNVPGATIDTGKKHPPIVVIQRNGQPWRCLITEIERAP